MKETEHLETLSWAKLKTAIEQWAWFCSYGKKKNKQSHFVFSNASIFWSEIAVILGINLTTAKLKYTIVNKMNSEHIHNDLTWAV